MRFEPEDPERRNMLPYAMDIGAPKFDLVPVTQQKDIMLNVARLHAQQEYDRIMELVKVLQKQADQIRSLVRDIELTNSNFDHWIRTLEETMCSNFDDIRREYSSYVDSRIDKLHTKTNKEVLKG
jgi:ribosome recycling factor